MRKSKKTRLKDISEELGLSITTISRVLSGHGAKYRISNSTQERVFAAAKEKHFTFNRLARALRIRETYTIGLIVPDISNPFFSVFAQNLEFEARKLGYAIILCDSGNNIAVEMDSAELLTSREVSGLIISPVGEKYDHLQRLHESHIPLVLIDRYFPEVEITYVGTDNYKGTYQATRYLLDCGHRRIGCIQGIPKVFINEQRIKGYEDALRQRGLTVDANLIKGDSFNTENGYLSTKLLINQPSPPTAILGFSNQISLGSLIALKEENRKVPDDMSIVAFDEQPYSDLLSITTIKQRTDEIGQIAIKLLVDQMAGGTVKQQERILLPPSLVIRNSVKIIQDVSDFRRGIK